MYLSYYQLAVKPFQINTDPEFLWLGGEHKEALANLQYGLLESNGYMVLVGAVGTGKTTLVNALLQSVDDRVVVANINFPSLNATEFLSFVARTYDPAARVTNKADSLLHIKRFLEQTRAKGKVVLLVIDEAHRLTEAVLEDIRLLSNMEQGGTSLINIFFVGQTELMHRLLSSHCRALRQRITLFYHLKPLSEAETLQYITHRLKVAGCVSQPFTPQAVHAVYKFSGGYPRLINKLCDRALLTGFVQEQITVDASIIVECAREISLIDPVPAKIFKIRQLIHTEPRWRQPSGADATTAHPQNRYAALFHRRYKTAASKTKWMGKTLKGWGHRRMTAILAFAQKKAGIIVAVNTTIAAVLIGVTLLVGILHYLPDKRLLPMTGQLLKGVNASNGDPNNAPSPAARSEPINLPSSSNNWSKPDPITVSSVIRPSIEVRMTAMLSEGDYQSVIQIVETEYESSAVKNEIISELYARALVGRAQELKHRAPKDARTLLEKATREDPNNIHALTALANDYIHAKDYSQAIAVYQKMLELAPQRADVLFNLGFVFASIGMYTTAEKTLAKVVELKPDFTDKALFNLAIVQQKLGRWQESLASLESAVAFAPDNQQARAYLNELKANPQDNP